MRRVVVDSDIWPGNAVCAAPAPRHVREASSRRRGRARSLPRAATRHTVDVMARMGTPRIPVSITHQGQAGRRIALIGDFPDWQHPIEMTERESGTYAVEIDLEPGIYRYKFLMDGRRYVDVHNPEFHDSAEGFQNGLLLVGGTLPPLYFAP